MNAPGYVQVAADGAGKRIDNAAVTLPAGTVVTGSDGTLTTLTVDTVVYRQAVHLSDPENPNARQNVTGEPGRGTASVSAESVVNKLDELHETLRELLGELREFVHS